MPLRSPKMNRRIFGFQRRVWWPKWTPASSSCFMVTTASGTSLIPLLGLCPPPACVLHARDDLEDAGVRDPGCRRIGVRPAVRVGGHCSGDPNCTAERRPRSGLAESPGLEAAGDGLVDGG